MCWCYEEKDITQRTPQGITETKKITKNHPDIEYLDLLDVAVDPGKPDIDKMDWVIVRKRCTWDYIKDRERRGLYSADQVAKIPVLAVGADDSVEVALARHLLRAGAGVPRRRGAASRGAAATGRWKMIATAITGLLPVVTPGGAGRVVEVQVGEAGCRVLVLLDAKRDRWGYRGDVYATDDVRKLVN